jgi:PAS domain S-box-containing protein
MLQTRGPYAVLVADLMMPGMNGLELLRAARSMDPRIEVMMISAAATLETAIAAMRDDGAYDYLLKPLESINQLSLAVERALGHRRLRLEREALQSRLATEAARLSALIANTGDAIIAADAEGRLTVVNPAAARRLDREDLVGQAALEHLPEALTTLVANWQSTGSQRIAVVEIHWPADALHMASLTPILDAESVYQGWVMVLRDITHLERQEELKMRLLTETAGKIRFPLAQAVVALAELSDMPEVKSGRASEIVYRMVRLWDRIQQWMDDLHSVVKIESGIGIHLTVVQLKPLLDELTEELTSGVIDDHGLRLSTHIAPGVPPVRADPDLLRQLLRGLVARAALRSPQGGVVHLSAQAQQDQVWIDVADEGPAVAEADLPHLFEVSFVESGVAMEGSGLELALAKTIMERLGGQVWVRGEGPVGSNIALCVPAVEAETAEPPARAGAQVPS